MGKLNEVIRHIFRNPLPPDPSFYLNLIQLCIESKAAKLGRIIHTYLLYNGFDSHLTLSNKMIIFYGKIGDMGNARKVFDVMPERNVVSWTALLSGYSQNGVFKDGLMVFRTMRGCGVKGNQFSYGSALRACTKLVCLRSGMQVQGCVQKSRFVGNLFVQSALVDLHSKCGSVEDARCVFEAMFERDLVCWNAMIGGYVVKGFAKDAFLMFKLMLREGMTPDSFTFGSLLTACAQDIDFPRVGQVHGFIVQHPYASNELLSKLLIDVYAKCGSTKRAYTLFKSLSVKDAMSYTAMISGYARERDHNNALHLFIEIYRSDVSLDEFLLCTAINICASSSLLNFGRQVHAVTLKCVPMYDVAVGNALIDMYAKCGELGEAHRAFDQMDKKNVISWSSLIDACAKHGYGNKAVELYKKMENEGLKPNDITFLSLLFACSHAGLTSEGWECFNSMIEKHNLAPTTKHYSCLIDLFARRGQLEEASNLMQRIYIQPNSSLWGVILGSSNIYGDMSVGAVAAKQLTELDSENSANYVALASVYAASGLWDDSRIMHEVMEQKYLKKSPGHSLLLSPGKRADPV